MRSSSFLKRHRNLIDECGLLALVLLLTAFAFQFTPVIRSVRVSESAHPGVRHMARGLPYNTESGDPLLTASFVLRERSILRPDLFTIRADDCLQNLVINGRAVPSALLGSCVVDTPRDIAIGEFLRDGDNEIVAVVPDTGGRQGFDLKLSHADPTLLWILTVLLLAFLFFVVVVVRNRVKSGHARLLIVILVLGFLLRLFYFGVTTYTVRSNDADGHLEYIEYMSEHWSVPAVSKGWQFYQPPLYYAFSGAVLGIARQCGFDYGLSIRLLQLFSILLSFLTLLACVWISRMLFDARRKTERLFFVGFFAFFPGMILLAPKLNNDALACLLSFVAVGLLLRFWQKAETRTWYALTIVLSLGMLTKMTVALLVPAAFLVVLSHPMLKLRSKFLLMFFGAWIIVSFTQWLFFLRLFQDANVHLVGNAGNLNSGLLIPNHVADYLTFHPFEILKHPFINPWSDAERRAYFLEYLFRSAFFGEFNFGLTLRFLSQCLLSFGLLFCGIGLLSALLRCIRGFETAFPLWAMFFFVLLGHALFRFQYPYASSQDFRYSAILLVPLAYFVLSAFDKKYPHCRLIVLTLSAFFLLCSVGFLLAVIVINPL